MSLWARRKQLGPSNHKTTKLKMEDQVEGYSSHKTASIARKQNGEFMLYLNSFITRQGSLIGMGFESSMWCGPGHRGPSYLIAATAPSIHVISLQWPSQLFVSIRLNIMDENWLSVFPSNTKSQPTCLLPHNFKFIWLLWTLSDVSNDTRKFLHIVLQLSQWDYGRYGSISFFLVYSLGDTSFTFQ